MAYYGIFNKKWLIWVFLFKIFKKTIVIFEISTLEFAYLQNLTKKQKYLALGRKMPDLGIFGLEFENNIVIFEISTLQFVYLQNFTKKQKCLNLGPKMPYLGIFGLEFLKTVVILSGIDVFLSSSGKQSKLNSQRFSLKCLVKLIVVQTIILMFILTLFGQSKC